MEIKQGFNRAAGKRAEVEAAYFRKFQKHEKPLGSSGFFIAIDVGLTVGDSWVQAGARHLCW